MNGMRTRDLSLFWLREEESRIRRKLKTVRASYRTSAGMRAICEEYAAPMERAADVLSHAIRELEAQRKRDD